MSSIIKCGGSITPIVMEHQNQLVMKKNVFGKKINKNAVLNKIFLKIIEVALKQGNSSILKLYD